MQLIFALSNKLHDDMNTSLEQIEQTEYISGTSSLKTMKNVTSLLHEDSPRIKDGLCAVEQLSNTSNEDNTPRLTATTRKHYGDDGYSLLMSGTRISKAHVACHFYSAIEELQQAIAEVLCYTKLYDKQVENVLRWLFKNLFSLSSFVFLKSESAKHQFPDEFLDYIEADCKSLQEIIGDAQDFLYFSNDSLLRLNKIRLAVRKAESAYVAWKQSEEMTRHQLANPPLIQGVNKHSQILNRLSSWIWWVTRRQGLFLQQNGVPLEEQYWSASCEPFNFTP